MVELEPTNPGDFHVNTLTTVAAKLMPELILTAIAAAVTAHIMRPGARGRAARAASQAHAPALAPDDRKSNAVRV